MQTLPNVLVYFVRHGDTDLNDANRFRGKRDVPLNATGFQSADELADFFEGKQIGKLITSDRIRAVQTADAIAKRHGMPITKDSKFRAWNVGDFSGQRKDKATMDAFDQYIMHPDMCVPGGESLLDFQKRIREGMGDAISMAVSLCKPILVVGHSSVIHEVGHIVYGNHKSALVEPGGAVALFNYAGRLAAEQIFKPRFEV